MGTKVLVDLFGVHHVLALVIQVSLVDQVPLFTSLGQDVDQVPVPCTQVYLVLKLAVAKRLNLHGLHDVGGVYTPHVVVDPQHHASLQTWSPTVKRDVLEAVCLFQ